MKKLLLVSLCFVLLFASRTFAQTRTVTGTVVGQDDGQPVPGATVKVQGASTAVATNAAGKFTIPAPPGAILVVSFVGYQTQQVKTGNSTTVNISLAVSAHELGEVVVTGALGIKHTEKELGYAVGRLTAKDITQTNAVNVANGLTGKIAGLATFSLNAGIDPGVAITLRGSRSLLGNNTALIVLDGVPVPGATISSINPDDIQDISVLKGAGSAALYGSEASNGAILITTKRGTSDNKPIVTYSNSFQLQQVAYYPKLQNKFGPYGGETSSVPILSGANAGSSYPAIDPVTGAPNYIPWENQLYGPAYDGSTVPVGYPLDSLNGTQIYRTYSARKKSPVKEFFNNGIIEQNEVTYQQGDSKNSVYISAQNAYQKGVVPDDKNIRNAVSFRGHRTLGIFSADYSIGYTRTDISTYGGSTNSLYNGSYNTTAGDQDLYSSVLQFPAFLNIKDYQNSGANIANPNNYYDAYATNPYWIIQNSRVNTQRDVLLSNLSLKVTPTSWFDATYRVSDNFGIAQVRQTNSEVDFSSYAASDPFGAGNIPSNFKSTLKSPGVVYDYYQYGDGSLYQQPGAGYARLQGDALLNFHHTFFKDFKTNLLLGNTIWQQSIKRQETGSNQLLIPNLYNIAYIGGIASASESEYKIRQISYYGDLSITYKTWLTLDGTLRNEHDSRLSAANRSYWYPSAKVSFIPTDAFSVLKDNKVLDYAKLYGSFSRVGNINVGPYNILNTYSVTSGFPFNATGGLTQSTTQVDPSLKPEFTNEIEFGTELSFFQSRLNVNATYYNQHTENQTVPINTSITTGYGTFLTNIGKTQSQGEEFQVTGDILTRAQNKVGLRIGANYSINNSKVISLLNGTNSLALGSGQYAVVGKPYPMLEGTDFVRDPQGHVVVSATTGYPSTAQGALTQFGRTTPRDVLGLNATISYKFISLYQLWEYRGGDVVYNGVGPVLNFAGASYVSASANRQPFIYPNSVIQTSPGVYVPNTSVTVANGNYGFWQSSAYSSTNSPFVSSGAFWKLREVDLNFDLSQFIKGNKYVKGLTFGITGRNLLMFTPKSNPWTDPEFSDANPFTTTRGSNSVSQTPGTRIYGANLRVTF